ncbi:MAG: rhomboid family intramembrane serine protease [Leifsonia sp.]|nr:rhomboid family intramembrane serine protease [Leifsonia sp.]
MSGEATTSAGVCYRHPERQSWVLCQRCGRTICPECQTQAAVGVQCPECVREGRAATRPTASRSRLARMFRPGGTTPVVTISIGAACVLLYVLQLVTGGAVTSALLMNPSAIASEPWRLLTSAFVHSPSSFLHIAFNMYALAIFGPLLESFLGRGRFLALYLLSALGGNVAGVLLYQAAVVSGGATIVLTNGFLQPSLSLGASGAIFGLMGALLGLRKALGVQITQLLVVLGLNVVIGFLVPNIAWEAHLGGLAVGFAIGTLFSRTRRPAQKRLRILGLITIGAVLVVICLTSVLMAPGAYS